ncbi:MAG: DUF3160 domain-containing protein, partial [Deltaproteobacteria bacterium]|nr:DUF3160 domain-containing protein [Deltaproteobacteria bacterium]
FPTLGAQLPVARAMLDARLGGGDLYAHWLRAIRAIAQVPAGARPSYMDTEAYADLRMSSAVTAFGQLRHAHALIAGMSYLGSGCEIPDGWVEPAAATYDALIAYADRGKAIVATLDPADATHGIAYFTRLGTTLRVLRGIVATELAGRPLTEAQRRWLSMVVEIVVDNSGSGAPPTYAGWYFDLFRNFTDATANARFIAGHASNDTTVSYIGASDTRMGVFVIDVGGPPRVVVGPVARSFELDHPISAGRLTDDDELDATAVREPWSTGYTTAAGAPPQLDLEQEWTEDGDSMKFVVTAPAAIGPVTLELLDHHRVPFATVTQEVKAGTTELRVRGARKRLEMLHLRVGAFNAWAEAQGDNGFGFWLRTRPD